MKAFVLAGLSIAALAVTAVAPAQAQGGCGPYGHRGWDGYCRPGGWARPRPYAFGYGYGWHRPHPYGYGRGPWGYHRHWGY
ncbi:GCG_CRPN prefix-to-repeats domain-containing protein [Lichenifustis flavocetrariae]|uniref:Sulfur globule protein n=1 Tax=Lichenifustis flavocetrariae TaxID=2949735 RepID=A0AA41YY58_9HYPH|nr:hypothetical protein [Lichenifustis flavocetrariae]MCW6509367.1 hypothetical protein [Lichenifustis flavocetrariae]